MFLKNDLTPEREWPLSDILDVQLEGNCLFSLDIRLPRYLIDGEINTRRQYRNNLFLSNVPISEC